MAAERLNMRQIKKVFQLRLVEGKSQNENAIHLGIGKTTVREYLQRLNKQNIYDWSQIESLNESELEKCLGFTTPLLIRKEGAMPDWSYIHKEMSKPHVTMSLLWTEYREENPQGYGYTQFCTHYNRWRGKLSVVMRQNHKAGEKTFIDYSGDGLWLVDPKNGERRETELFVACLGASSYTYPEATLTQRSPEWIASHVRMSEYFGGTSELWVPDNLKPGVTKADRYEPLLNETYQECAGHYGACVIPARAARPKDKAKVEAAVLVAQRWILARLRNRIFTSLAEINEAIGECLEILNNRKMRNINKSRLELFEELERSVLKGLPEKSYEYAEWKKATVNIDYHITLDHHRYSVPYQLVHVACEVRSTSTIVEVFHKGKRISSHRRSYKHGGYTTLREQMPKSHREYAEWTPERVVEWSRKIGSYAAAVVERIMATKVHPQQGFMAALGLIRLSKPYGNERVERACQRAIEVQVYSYQFIKQMLKNNMEGASQKDASFQGREVEKSSINEIKRL